MQVLHLLFHVMIMILDRLAYLNRSLVTKLFTQALSVSYVHYKVFYASPLTKGAICAAPLVIHALFALSRLRCCLLTWSDCAAACCPSSGLPTLSNRPLTAFYCFYFAYVFPLSIAPCGWVSSGSGQRDEWCLVSFALHGSEQILSVGRGSALPGI
jgi:hypothetical protein